MEGASPGCGVSYLLVKASARDVRAKSCCSFSMRFVMYILRWFRLSPLCGKIPCEMYVLLQLALNANENQ